jgi:hypothetical protein
MRSIEYVLRYALAQAIMHACCRLLEQESDAIISKMPEGQREYACIQTSLYDEDNPTAQLWRKANKEQKQVIREWENR